MAILVKKSNCVKRKIQVRMLGAVIFVYVMLIISGLMAPKNLSSYYKGTKDSIVIYHKHMKQFTCKLNIG